MTFATVRSEVDERFRQARDFLALIKAREAAEDKSVSSDTKMLRGLYFVHLYSAFEFSVNRAVQEALRSISHSGAKLNELEPRFHAVSLNHFFQAYVTIRADKRWKKRIEIVDAPSSTDPCVVNDSLFGEFLQNIWAETFIDVCNCLCLPSNSCPSPRDQRYIDEVVERRNAVAHGRESPQDVGERTNGVEHEVRHGVISQIVTELIDTLDLHVSSASYAMTAYRPLYIK